MSLTYDVISAIGATAAKYETKPEHWIHGWDESFSFCFECAEKKVAELLATEPEGDYLVDGGWGTEGDSQAFCESCQCALDNSFTTYACEQELDHFEGHGFDPSSPDDCHSLIEILHAEGCESSPLWSRIEPLARQALAHNEPERETEIQKVGVKEFFSA